MSTRYRSPRFAALLLDGLQTWDDATHARWYMGSEGVSVSVDSIVIRMAGEGQVIRETFSKLHHAWVETFCDPGRWKAVTPPINNRAMVGR